MIIFDAIFPTPDSLGALSVMANAPRVTYGQGIARHHGSHRSRLPTPCSLK
ncbi:MAG: hypothetical protein F6K56_44125 [Moorea sp. SIO3G5]|nr:hypothetical protein [Moorena sp. SIO3G5]